MTWWVGLAVGLPAEGVGLRVGGLGAIVGAMEGISEGAKEGVSEGGMVAEVGMLNHWFLEWDCLLLKKALPWS